MMVTQILATCTGQSERPQPTHPIVSAVRRNALRVFANAFPIRSPEEPRQETGKRVDEQLGKLVVCAGLGARFVTPGGLRLPRSSMPKHNSSPSVRQDNLYA